MRASQWIQTLPDRGPEREQAVLDAVRAGWRLPFEWIHTDVELRDEQDRHPRRLVRYWVSADVLKIGEPGDAVRVNVSARTAQLIAYELDCVLPTTRICDALYRRAVLKNVELAPCIQPALQRERLVRFGSRSPFMDDKQAMVLHSDELDAAIAKRGIDTHPRLVCNAGKDWVLTNVLETKPVGTAANYGWFDPRAPYRTASGLRAWQQLGTRHNLDHVDYSQTLRLVKAICRVDGYLVPFESVATSAELNSSVSDEGPLERVTLRGVEPETPPTSELPTRPDP